MRALANLSSVWKAAILAGGVLALAACYCGGLGVLALMEGSGAIPAAVASQNLEMGAQATLPDESQIPFATAQQAIENPPASGVDQTPAAPQATGGADLQASETPAPPLPPRPIASETVPVDQAMLNAVQVFSEPSNDAGMRVELRYADGAPKRDSYVMIYQQITDVSGNPIAGERVDDGYTDDSGAYFSSLPPGTYVIELSDMHGYPWGEAVNYVVNADSVTVVRVTLGRLQIGVRDADAKPLEERWIAVYVQVLDVSGNPIKGERVADGYTDNTGVVTYDLTPGIYAIEISGIEGELWGEELNHVVPSGGTTPILLTLSRLVVGIKNADGSPVEDRYVSIYYQEQDLAGNPIKGEQFLSGYTANSGLVAWDVTAGIYAVQIHDIEGYPWGEEYNHTLTSGQTTSIVLTLGRLLIGLKDSNGAPISNRYIRLSEQAIDAGGNLNKGDQFLSGYTDDAGLLAWDLSAGRYVIEIDEIGTLMDVPVEAGKITTTDGHTYSLP